MKNFIFITVLLMCLREHNVIALNLPGPRVYVVTPSSRQLQIDEGRSRPFYYHNWMRRMDDTATQNTTSTTSRATEKVKTPDLIFAEFESDSTDDMKKSIRKLLEKEKVVPQSTTKTTFRPIYVPDEEFHKDTNVMNYGLPINAKKRGDDVDNASNSPIEYYDTYNNVKNNVSSHTFQPSTTQSILFQTESTKTTAPGIDKVENIWQIIDSEKNTQNSGNWEEVPIESNKESSMAGLNLLIDNHNEVGPNNAEDEIDENFALPGFGSNPGNGGENESRAIRNEHNIRFPYVNLKTFQLKNLNKPSNNIMNHRKENNLMTSLDNFHDLKNPVRGESQDVMPTRNVDRYNPAQPYLPPSVYGNKVSKQNSVPTPSKATAMLVPPPPPPTLSDNNFPLLTSPYESFPPYAAPSFDSAPPVPPRPPPRPPKPSVPIYSPPAAEAPDDSDTNVDSDSLPDNDPSMDVQFRYKPGAPPVPQFAPTLPPVSKPFTGYSYEKPPVQVEQPMMPSMDDNSDFHGYHYSKPDSTAQIDDHKTPPASSYGHDNAPPTYDHDSDYPELIFQKHHGGADDSKGTDDMTGMAPPPMDMKPIDHGPPTDDHGFPSDFPGDFKYHHDFDDHDFYHHHHHHHPTTTTTTTEMPRVNRYSYYYLGKKLYYLPLYFSIYFIVYVGALIIKAVLRHKIVYPNSWRPNTTTASFFSKRSVDAFLSNDNLHEVTGRVTHAVATAAEKYLGRKSKNQ